MDKEQLDNEITDEVIDEIHQEKVSNSEESVENSEKIENDQVIYEVDAEEIENNTYKDEKKESSFSEKHNIDGIFNQIKELVISWFSERPLSAFTNVLERKTSIILIGIHILVALFVLLISSGSMMSMLPGFSMNAFSQIGARFAIPFIFVMILFFAILSFTINLVAKIIRVKDKSFDSSMSLVAIAFIPSSVMILIGTILGFIFMPLAMLTHAISAMTLLLALYLGLQKHLGRPEKSPFWILPLMLIAMFIVFTIVLSIFAKIYYQMMMNALQRDLMNQFKGNGLNLFE